MVSLSEVGGLAEDAQVVRSNMVENDQDADIKSRTNVLTDHHGCSITTSIRRSDYVNSASRYSVPSQKELDHQMSHLENDEAFSVSVPRLKHHENSLINLVTRENSERMFSDHQKRKKCLFPLSFFFRSMQAR